MAPITEPGDAQQLLKQMGNTAEKVLAPGLYEKGGYGNPKEDEEVPPRRGLVPRASDSQLQSAPEPTPPSNTRLQSRNATLNSPSKRQHAAISASDMPSNSRDASKAVEGDIRPAKNFAKFVDYNFSTMTDTKGGFLEDDTSLAKAQKSIEGKPAHMTVAEWERMQTIRNLKRLKQGPYEPPVNPLADEKDKKRCRECGTLDIDFVWEEVFAGVRVCNPCKDKHPEKYSLLTKTECKEDYLLTDPELKDVELLPHLNKPNPHKSHWHDMMLFLRFQVEDYAINTKWGSAEALDAEFARREADKKRRKEQKFKEKLLQLKKKTRTEAYRRNHGVGSSAGGKATTFGDQIGSQGRHVHEWGRAIENDAGLSVKKCLSCSMEVEELEF